jgi:hypothetical protein
LREEHRLRVFENSVLRIFGPKRGKTSWRKLHNDELHGRDMWHAWGRSVYRVLVGRPEGKRQLGRPRRRRDDNIKMDLKKIEIDGANWIRLAQDRVQ